MLSFKKLGVVHVWAPVHSLDNPVQKKCFWCETRKMMFVVVVSKKIYLEKPTTEFKDFKVQQHHHFPMEAAPVVHTVCSSHCLPLQVVLPFPLLFLTNFPLLLCHVSTK